MNEEIDVLNVFKDAIDDFGAAIKTGELEDFGEVIEDIAYIAQNGEAIWGEVKEFLENAGNENAFVNDAEYTM